jgi:CRP-like cAMP-binding protein
LLDFYLNGRKPVYQLGVNHRFGHWTRPLRLCARWFFAKAQRVAETMINAVTSKAKPHAGNVFSLPRRRRVVTRSFITEQEVCAMWPVVSSGRDVASEFSKVQPTTAGRILFRQNDHPQSVAFVVSGWVKTVRLEQDGEGRGVALYTKGSLLGLVELLAGQKYSDTTITLSPSNLCWITNRVFFDFIRTDTRFFWQVNQALSRQNYARGICLAQSSSLPLRQRLEQLIWQLLRAQSRDGATPNGGRGECKLLAPVQNQDLARMLGVTAACFSRTLKMMETEGVLQRRKGRMIFPDLERLWRAPEIESLVESNCRQNSQLTLADPIYA